jgi:uncharacterized protein YdiU (UPF0061 family)
LVIEFVENYKQRLSNNQISGRKQKNDAKSQSEICLENYLLYDCIAEMEEGKTELFDKLWKHKILTKKLPRIFGKKTRKI